MLTHISLFWFKKLGHVIPTHFVTADISEMPAEVQVHRETLEGRAMLVKKAKVVPLEAIVRGYITGTSCYSPRLMDRDCEQLHCRFRMVRVQEIRYRPWHSAPGGLG